MAAPAQRFGKYTLSGKVAQGGMAEIFRARFRVANDITKQVIIKRILPRYAENERFIQMFATEARIAMGFSHGNIAQVFDFGEVDGAWFLAMELVDGQALSKILKAARTQGIPALPPHLAAMVIADMLKGLHYAHTRMGDDGAPLNIVHRDVSPQNVLVSYEGQVKLVDFGIAKARTASEKTEAGVIKGKYLYFSPEQVQEQPLDGRTDVFAAGSVLYQLLTGHHPFKGEVHDVMRAIVRGELTPPSDRNPDVPPELEAVVLKAMAPRLEDRYQSAADFERALSGWLHGAAPDASSDELAQLVRLLFATELAAEGRPVQADEAFRAEFNSWKREADEDDQTTSETKSERSEKSSGKSRSVRTTRAKTRTGAVRAPLPRSLFVGLAVFGLVAAVATLKLIEAPPTFDLEVTSTPPGAQVRVDGHAVNGTTPAVVKDLAVSLPHAVVVTAPGMRPWEMEARGRAGAQTLLHAELEKLPEPTLAPPEPPTPVLAPPVPAVDNDAIYPAGVVKVFPAHHTKRLEASNAAYADLDPAKSYKVWLEGKVSFGGRVADIWVDDCLYALEGPAVTQGTAYGVLNKTPISISGATRIYAFIGDTGVGRHSGAFRLNLQAKGEAPKMMLVDSISHNVMPEPSERMTITNLRVFDHYKVTLSQGGDPAHFRPKGTKTLVVMGQEVGVIGPVADARDRQPHRVLEVGKTYSVSAAGYIWFWFPDDDPKDNSGNLEVAVEVDHSVFDLGPGFSIDQLGPRKRKPHSP